MRRILIVLILCFVWTDQFAQVIGGIKGGLNISTQRYRTDGDDIVPDNRAKIAFHLGILYQHAVGDFHGVQPELFYSLEGSRAGEFGGSMNLSYLKLPVMWYFDLGEEFRVLIGPEFAYLLNARANSQGFASDRRDGYENFVVSGALGVEYLFGSGVHLGVRYSRGLSDFLNNDFYTFDLRSKTDTFQLYTAFVFRVY